MPGPKPKSPELRQAQGSRLHRRKTLGKEPPAAPVVPPDQAPAAPPDPVSPPKWLSVKSRNIWRAAAPAIFRRGLLSDADAIGFGRYCDWLARYIELQKSGRGKRVVTETKSRHVKMQRMDKGFQALAIVDKRLTDYEDRFGMNPRERLAIMKALAEGAGQRPPQAPPAKPAEPDTRASRVETPERMPDSPVGFLGGVRH